MMDFSLLSLFSFEEVVHLVHDHQYAIAAISPFIIGEAVVHLFGILIGSGDVSFSPLAVIVVSVVFYETVAYALVQFLKRRYELVSFVERIPGLSHVDALFKKYQSRYRHHPYFLLFAIKTVPMTKFTVMFYALRHDMPISLFILRDIALTVLWVVVMFVPGFLVGKEFLTEAAGRNLFNFILFFVLIVVVMIFLGEYLERLVLYLARCMRRFFRSEH